MSRFYVAGPARGAAETAWLQRVASRIHSDGHAVAGTRQRDAGESPVDAVRESDAVVAILDGAVDGATAAAVALAHAHKRPVLGLRTRSSGPPLPPLVEAMLTTLHEADDEDGLLGGLARFYDKAQPFAGRLVRDEIPRLVAEAGHDLRFRRLTDEEKPRFLKRKIAEEARALERVDASGEREEVADLLEALEAFLQARGYDRGSLKQVKDAKRKRRGGFERGFVVEATGSEVSVPESSAPDALPASPVEESREVPEGAGEGDEELPIRSPKPQFFEV